MTYTHEKFKEITRTIEIIKGMIRTNCEQIRLLHSNNKQCREALKHWKNVRRELVLRQPWDGNPDSAP